MTQAAPTPAAKLMALLNGSRITQAIGTCARLKLADFVSSDPRSVSEIARDAGTHPEATFRLMRALAGIGIFEAHDAQRFSSNELSDALSSNGPGSVQAWAAFVAGPGNWRYWGELMHAVQTGEDAPRFLDGDSIWAVRAKQPEMNALFNAAMSAVSGATVSAILETFDFGRFRRFVDVGGGDGTLLAAILRANPAASGAVFDLPHVAAAAQAKFASSDLAGRAEAIGGSFFSDPIPTGADAYIMKSVLCDSHDEEAARVLAPVREAMSPDSSLLLIESVVAPGDPNIGFFDLNMLVATGGKERTIEEWTALLEGVGMRLIAAHAATGSRFHVLEARLRWGSRSSRNALPEGG